MVETGTLVLPSGVLTIGGSFTNSSIFTNSSGQVTFNSSDTGETINAGNSSFYNVLFNSGTGGWTITNNATATNNVTLTALSDFTLSAGQTLSVGQIFTNSVGGASTTWAGATLALENGSYNINSKSDVGDIYDTLRISSTADISMCNSSANIPTILNGGSLYSQDHAGTYGDLYIYGSYERNSGTEYWSYATDFDGTDLSGGGERQANIRLADNTTVAITNSVFNVVGLNTASTTIQNQGSGTYTVSVSSGTTTAQYYDFKDLGSTGVSLLSGNKVTTLLDGAYEVGTVAGTALTLSSTTIDANPAKQIYRVKFSTSTVISANNVTQTDGTPTSYWWFRNSFGNLDGETKDNDTGDPGSVRWDNSSLVITVSGTVYTDDGSTPLTGGTCNDVLTPVRVVVEGGGVYDGSCGLLNGDFSIGGVVIVGDPVVTVFLNGAFGGERAVAVTKTPTDDINDLDLYTNRVIVRHEDVDPLTIADMAVYDSTDDTDIRFTAATGTIDTLTLQNNTELHLWATTTFTPDGDITLNANASGNTYDGSLHIANGATFTGAGTSTYTIGGNIAMDSSSTFIPASTSVLMTATTTGKAIMTVGAETLTLHDLSFVGNGGGWNLNGNISATGDIAVSTGTLTGTGDVTLTDGSINGNGVVSFGAGLTKIDKTNIIGGTSAWTFYDLTLGSGTVVGTTTPISSATTTVSGTLTIGTAHFLDAGNSKWNLAGTGTVFVENGTFLEDTSTIIYSGVGATNILSTDYYNLTVDALGGSPTYTVVGSGIQVFNDFSVGPNANTTVDFNTNDPALNIDGNLIIGTNGTFISSNIASSTIAGDYENNGIFTSSGGTIIFDGPVSSSISAGNSSFGNIIINGTGDFIVIENATATAIWTLTNANSFTVNSGTVLAVGGLFTNNIGGAGTVWSGSTLYLYGGGNYTINTKTISDIYGTLSVGSGTQIRMWNSNAATTSVHSLGSLYSQDNANTDGDL